MSLSLFKPRNTGEMVSIATDILESGQIASGEYIQAFEDGFADLIGVEFVLSTNDMTNAMYLALKASGVGVGDEVLAIAFSCMASNAPISLCGATVTWIDFAPNSLKVDLEQFESSITKKTKAAVIYHIAGYLNAIEDITHICKKHGVKLIEDCNNALLAEANGKIVGTFGDFSVFSFYPNRLINASEGGALVCKHKEDYENLKRMRRFGINMSNFRNSIGEIEPLSDIKVTNFSMAMNNLCCGLAFTQLKDVKYLVQRNRKIAKIYDNCFQHNYKINIFVPKEYEKPSYWVYFVLVENKNSILNYMKRHGINVSGLHQRNDHYSCFNTISANQMTNLDLIQESIIALPCGWWMSETDARNVVNVLFEAIISCE